MESQSDAESVTSCGRVTSQTVTRHTLVTLINRLFVPLCLSVCLSVASSHSDTSTDWRHIEPRACLAPIQSLKTSVEKLLSNMLTVLCTCCYLCLRYIHKMSLKWSVLCRVARKTLNQSSYGDMQTSHLAVSRIVASMSLWYMRHCVSLVVNEERMNPGDWLWQVLWAALTLLADRRAFSP